MITDAIRRKVFLAVMVDEGCHPIDHGEDIIIQAKDIKNVMLPYMLGIVAPSVFPEGSNQQSDLVNAAAKLATYYAKLEKGR